MPDPFVFAVLLTLLVGVLALVLTPSGPMDVLSGWYDGFWNLLTFGMQMVLMLATGFAIALSPPAAAFVNVVARLANTPVRVYALVVLIGGLLTLVSWGWVVITAVIARELAERVKGIDYAYLTACVYISSQTWVAGSSSSIPLLLNTDGNFMIQQNLLSSVVPVSVTLGSVLNVVWTLAMLLVLPAMMVLFRPRVANGSDLEAMRDAGAPDPGITVADQALALTGTETTVSNKLNRSAWITMPVALAGLIYVVYFFATRGFDLNLNIVIFTFLMLGMLAHRTAIRYAIAMKRACSDISGIVYQYPFYAGIMGIMLATGLGALVSEWIIGSASLTTLPLFAQAAGAIVNFAVPSAGGEWAVIGPSLVDAAQTIGADLSPAQQESLIARVAMAAAYGETSTNLIQPFFLLAVLPIMGAGTRVQARDVMGHLLMPFAVIYLLTAVLIVSMPV